MQATRVALLLIIGGLLLVPPATAVPGIFGSHLLLGEADWVPSAKGDSKDFVVVQANFGNPTNVQDDCFVLRTTGTTAAIKTKDLRFAPCLGKPVGAEIVDTDVDELTATWMLDADQHT